MKTFNDFLLEGRWKYNANNTVVVDIQPEYQKHIHFSIPEFAQFLKTMIENRKKILYFFNGSTIGSNDNEESIIHWLLEEEMYANDDGDTTEIDNLYRLFKRNIVWIDKGYGFFRGWMDQGVDDATLIKFIRLMVMKRIGDSRDLEDEIAAHPELPIYDNINLPDISIPMLKQFNGAYLCGGEKENCLKEVRLLFNAFNIRYTLFNKFIY